MTNVIIYIFPLVMNIITGILFFAGPMRATENGASVQMVSMVFTTYGIGYVIFCLLMGKIVKVHLAKIQMVASSLFIAILLAVLAASENITITMVIYCLFPFGTAMFFNAFQAFMKDVNSGQAKPLTHSVGMYFASVSIGFALGPFLSGWLREFLPWSLSFLTAAILSLIVAIATYFFKPQHSSTSQKEDTQFADKPDLALSGWVGAMFGTIALSLWLTLFPKVCEYFDLRPGFRGMVLFVQHIFQAGVALSLMKSKTWLFKPHLAPLYNLSGVLALFIAFFTSSPFMLFIAALFFGTFSANFFFTAIFHSLSHPSKSVKNIAFNESFIGAGFFIGPQLVSLTGLYTNFRTPYLFALSGLFIVMIFQYFFIRTKSMELS
jgi:MFS family permease